MVEGWEVGLHSLPCLEQTSGHRTVGALDVTGEKMQRVVRRIQKRLGSVDHVAPVASPSAEQSAT